MKKVLIAILAVVALASCHQEDAPQGVKYPILFGNYETRATAGLDDLKEYGFKVYAYFEGNTGNSHTFVKEVTYSSAQNVWGYEGLEYWIPGATYWFKAFYPTEPSAGTLTVYNTSSTQSFTIADFDISKQEDIMVAETAREGMLVDKSTGAPLTGSVVYLKFEHLLSNVTIAIKADINVTINEVTLKYLPVKGNYDKGLWSSTQEGNIYMTGLNKTLSAANNDFVDVTDGGFLTLPTTVESAKLYVKTANKEYELSIPSVTWSAGIKYTYKLTIKQDDILFDEPSVEEWDEENAVGSVIIK